VRDNLLSTDQLKAIGMTVIFNPPGVSPEISAIICSQDGTVEWTVDSDGKVDLNSPPSG
jgi:hypothetical protein